MIIIYAFYPIVSDFCRVTYYRGQLARRAVEVGCKNLGFTKNLKNLKSPNLIFFKVFF